MSRRTAAPPISASDIFSGWGYAGGCELRIHHASGVTVRVGR